MYISFFPRDQDGQRLTVTLTFLLKDLQQLRLSSVLIVRISRKHTLLTKVTHLSSLSALESQTSTPHSYDPLEHFYWHTLELSTLDSFHRPP